MSAEPADRGPWDAPEPKGPAIERAVRGLEQAEALDGVAGTVANVVKKLVPPGAVKDALSGTWLGHPLHPFLTDFVIGAWSSALLLDVAGGEDAQGGADKLVGAGIVAALPTAISGASDWADCIGKERRVGLVHATANYLALGLYGGSLRARRRGRRGRGVALSLAGMTTLSVGGYLGAHLSYARGVGVQETAHEKLPDEWTAAIAESDVPGDGGGVVADVGGVKVLIARQGGRICAIDNRCNHRGGSLGDGEFERGCVTCPLHGSTFSLSDGSVVSGPATQPQPAFDVRVHDGQVEVKARALDVA
jgi:nitrite reductase/ring-hydroxylating ferredoxin subunit/uncharacterized membrane protein